MTRFQRADVAPGERFGLVTVLREATKAESKKRALWCECVCGYQRPIRTHNLRRMQSTTCMCAAYALRKEAHGDRVTLFWKRVEKTEGCWLFRASPDRFGYGRFHIDGKAAVRAHRVSWFLHHGVWPELCVLHRCDNPACVRPDHLFLGTHADNNRDMTAKGRNCRGESRYSAKLTDDAVREIRRLHASGGHSQMSLGRRFGVNGSIVCEVLSGKRWSHVQ